MASFYDYLQNKTPEFSIKIKDSESNIPNYIRKQFINSPYLLSTVKQYTYSYSIDRQNNSIILHFSITYDLSTRNYMVFQVRNQLELNTAISLMYRFHFAYIKIIVDNNKAFINKENKYSIIYNAKTIVDEELQTSQMSSSSLSCSIWFNGKLIIYTLENALFDSAKAVNDMSCCAATLGIRLRNENRNERQLLEALKDWFSQNITYQNNHSTIDHSAVNLVAKKTGVCQAIAAFAFQVLSFCGLKVRYVHGEGDGIGGWSAHAWNMVFIDNCWIHVDFTFSLHNRNSIIKPMSTFKKNHRWNEELYSALASETYVQTRRALDHSIIITIPDTPCYSVNGCIVDTTNTHPICIKASDSSKALVSLFDIVTIAGGYHELIGENVHFYFDSYNYQIPLISLQYYNGTWYCPVSLLNFLSVKVDLIGSKIILQSNN